METCKDVWKVAEEMDKTLNSGVDFRDVVCVKHDDGTECRFCWATMREYTTKEGMLWYLVFTEHNNFHIFAADDTEYCYVVNARKERSAVIIKQMENEMKKDKIITMHEIELDLEGKVINGLCEYALKMIKNDTAALVSYAANKILEEVVRTNGACLGKVTDKIKKTSVKKKKSKKN
jgi:hypothetical protein